MTKYFYFDEFTHSMFIVDDFKRFELSTNRPKALKGYDIFFSES